MMLTLIVLQVITIVLLGVAIFHLLSIPNLKLLLPKKKLTNLPAGISPINPNTSVRECQFCSSKTNVQKSPDGYYACDVCRVTKLQLRNASS